MFSNRLSSWHAILLWELTKFHLASTGHFLAERMCSVLWDCQVQRKELVRELERGRERFPMPGKKLDHKE